MELMAEDGMHGADETNEIGEAGAMGEMGWPDERDGTRAMAGSFRGGPERPERPAHRPVARHGR